MYGGESTAICAQCESKCISISVSTNTNKIRSASSCDNGIAASSGARESSIQHDSVLAPVADDDCVVIGVAQEAHLVNATVAEGDCVVAAAALDIYRATYAIAQGYCVVIGVAADQHYVIGALA